MHGSDAVSITVQDETLSGGPLPLPLCNRYDFVPIALCTGCALYTAALDCVAELAGWWALNVSRRCVAMTRQPTMQQVHCRRIAAIAIIMACTAARAARLGCPGVLLEGEVSPGEAYTHPLTPRLDFKLEACLQGG